MDKVTELVDRYVAVWNEPDAAAASLDSALLNAGNGTVNFALADGGAFLLVAPDVSPSLFIPGTSFSSVTGTFAGGSVVTVTTTIP